MSVYDPADAILKHSDLEVYEQTQAAASGFKVTQQFVYRELPIPTKQNILFKWSPKKDWTNKKEWTAKNAKGFLIRIGYNYNRL